MRSSLRSHLLLLAFIAAVCILEGSASVAEAADLTTLIPTTRSGPDLRCDVDLDTVPSSDELLALAQQYYGANCLLELGDSVRAERLYLQALSSASDYGPALSALGDIYMARRDYRRALEMMMRGAKMGFSSSKGRTLNDLMEEMFGDSRSTPPLPPAQFGLSFFVELSPRLGTPRLVIPKFGEWDDIATLAGSMRELSRVMSQVYNEYADLTRQYDSLVRQAATASSSRPGDPWVYEVSFSKQLLHLKLIRIHF